jgi:acetylornithine deacetylase
MAADDMIDRIRATVGAAAAGAPFTLEYVSESPAMILNAEADIHRQLCAAVGQRESRSVMFATDAGWLQRMGLECVLYGPGSIEVAHRPNEFVPVAELERAGDILDQIIRQRCRSA